MRKIGSFKIEGSFKLTDRGFVIYGDIASGTVNRGNFFTFNIGQQDIKLKIKGVDFLDKMKDKITRIGLTFNYDNREQEEDLQKSQVIKQMAIITDQ